MKKLSTLLCLFMALSLSLWSQASVQIIHNSPTPGTAAGPVVDIYVNGALLPELTGVAYRTATPYLSVPANADIEVGVALNPSTGPGDIIATFPLGQLADGEVYTITAAGIVGDMDTPFNVFAGGGQTVSSGGDQVAIQAFHGSTNAPAVDVDARFVGNLIPNLAYSTYSGYLEVPAGSYFLDVRAAGDPNIVATFQADLSSLGGGAANVFASGLLGGAPAFGLFAALPNGTVIELPAASIARLQLIHNSPSPTVDVYVNGALYEDDFAFRTATEFRTVPAGVALDVAIALGNSTGVEDALVTFEDIILDNGGTYVVTANGIVGNADTPFTLAINGAAQEAGTPGTVAVAAFHGSPGAPNVDIAARGAGNIITDLAYNTYTAGYLALPPANYILDVKAAGDDNIVASFQADITSLDGGAATVFASGLLGSDPAFGLFAALADGTVIELPAVSLATLQVIHNSPSPTVDIYVNGALYEDDFAYLTATEAREVPAGVELNIAIAPETSTSADDAIFTTTVTLENGENYTAVANGIVGDIDFPFGIALTDGAQLTGTNANAIDIRAFHGIPGAPAVDIYEINNDVTPFVNLSYGDFSAEYVAAAPGPSFFEIRPTGTATTVGTFFGNLTGGGGLSGVVFAGGLLDEAPLFNLYLVLPNGAVITLTPLAPLQIIHNSPAAAAAVVDVYAGINPATGADYSLIEDDLAFRTATSLQTYYPTRLPLTIGIAPPNSTDGDDILFSLPPFTLEDGKLYTAIANGIPGDANFPFGLEVNDDARIESSDEGLVGITAFHGSPGAPNVDIATRSNGATAISDLAYGDFTGYLEVADVAEFLELRAAGDPNLVATFDATVLEVIGGTAVTVFASGILGDEPAFGLFAALPNGNVAELGSVSRLQIIHNSPDPTVDIYVNGENAVPGLTFRSATGMIDLPTRTPIDIAVVPAGADIGSAVATLEGVVLDDGKVYLAMASGVVGDATTPFNVVINDMGRDRAADAAEVDLVLFHGAPDAPTVDVVVEDGPVLFDNIEYGTFSDYLGVAPAAYVLDVTPADDNTTVVKKYDADVTTLTGQAAVVFASGFLTPDVAPAFEAWVALTDGTTFPLAEIVRTNEIPGTLDAYQVFPNPARAITTVDFNLTEPTEIFINLVNQEGKVLLNKAFGQLGAGNYREQLDLGNWPAGLYQLQLVTPEGQATLPLLIIK